MDIVGYLRQKGIEVKSAGQISKCRCPFHTDNTPSFIVYPDQHFHCFSCSAHGTIHKLIRLLEFGNIIDDKEAWRKTFRFLGVEHPTIIPQKKDYPVERKLTEEEKICLMWATTIYTDCLKEHREAIDYLIGRGIPEEVVLGNFREPWWPQITLGYCAPDGSTGPTIEHYVRKALEKSTIPALRDLGLINDNNWERFCGRVVIPEWRGFAPVFLQGRRIDRKPELPYLFLPIPKPVYFAELLLNRQSTPHPERVWLCEGIFDALSLIIGGEVALALLGVTIKDEILPYLKGCEEIVLAVDADQDGKHPQKQAQIELPRKLWRAGINKVTIPAYPKGVKDINAWAVMWGIESVLETPRKEVERVSKVA